jgi:hypothetical protein
MTYQHPITPPPELVQQWTHGATEAGLVDEEIFAARAAQWGADQELEACCEWLRDDGWRDCLARLRAARRPKPPSLAEEALGIIERGRDEWNPLPEDWDKLQAAAERLAELEKQATP